MTSDLLWIDIFIITRLDIYLMKLVPFNIPYHVHPTISHSPVHVHPNHAQSHPFHVQHIHVMII